MTVEYKLSERTNSLLMGLRTEIQSYFILLHNGFNSIKGHTKLFDFECIDMEGEEYLIEVKYSGRSSTSIQGKKRPKMIEYAKGLNKIPLVLIKSPIGWRLQNMETKETHIILCQNCIDNVLRNLRVIL